MTGVRGSNGILTSSSGGGSIGGNGLQSTRDSFFVWLEEKHHVMDLVVADVARYNDAVRAKAEQVGGSSSSSS